MGAPPPSSGLFFVRVEILSPKQAKAPPAGLWDAVTVALNKWGKPAGSKAASSLQWERFPAVTSQHQRGYKVTVDTGSGVGDDFPTRYKELRAELTNALSSAPYGIKVDEWTQVKYGHIGEAPRSLADCFTSHPGPFASSKAKGKASRRPARKAPAKKKTKKRK